MRTSNVMAAVLGALSVGTAAAAAWGLWALPLVMMVLALLGYYLWQPLMRQVLRMARLSRGAALRQCRLTVHAVTPAGLPDLGTDDGETTVEDHLSRVFFHLDMTLAPRPRAGGWEPNSLTLVRPGFHMQGNLEDDACVIRKMQIHLDGAFSDEVEPQVESTQRLRLLIGVRPLIEQLTLQYFFENLGTVTLPPSILSIPVRPATMPS